jgi:hypothetical protein
VTGKKDSESRCWPVRLSSSANRHEPGGSMRQDPRTHPCRRARFVSCWAPTKKRARWEGAPRSMWGGQRSCGGALRWNLPTQRSSALWSGDVLRRVHNRSLYVSRHLDSSVPSDGLLISINAPGCPMIFLHSCCRAEAMSHAVF